MSNFTPHWQGTIRGFHTYGADPWQICIELPPGPNVFDGTSAPGPSVRFSRGQEVHVLTSEGLAELKAQALEEAADELDALQTPQNDHPSRRDPSAWLINRAEQIRADN